MARFLIAAALAAASPWPACASAADAPISDADPALWVVNDHDTVIYLFGTFHALDGRSAWFNDEVETAFAAANELVLETIVPDLGRQAAPRPTAAAPSVPVSRIPVTPSASFLASTRLAISAGKARGLNADKGADAVLRYVAEATGKRVGGLESFEYQLGMFASIPSRPAQRARAGEAVAPAQVAPSMDDLGTAMTQMQAAWNRGDSSIFAMMLNQMAANAPDSYNVMFAQRNVKWANWIAQRLQQPGTVFLAVGVGHLAGHDSVQAKLAQRGVRSARIN